MTTEEAIEILELHNQWRKGAEIPMDNPVRLGMAIDIVVCELKSLLFEKAEFDCHKCKHSFSNPFDQNFCRKQNEKGKEYDLEEGEDCGGIYYEHK